MQITIPNLGDIDEVEVIELCVAVGDRVAVEDALVVIESDKASMEIPSPVAGVVASLEVSVGDMVQEGALVAEITQEAAESAGSDEPPPAAAETKPETADTEPAATEPAATEPATPSSQEIEVLVPDIGDVEDVVVIEVAVSEGDTVDADDLLVVLESDKASMEITAEHPGTVTRVAVTVDQPVKQGTLIATLATTSESAPSVATPSPAVEDKPDVTAAEVSETPAAAPAPASEPSGEPAGEARSDGAAKVYAGPAVRRLARELGVDLTAVKGTGNRDRITKDDVKAYVKNRFAEPAGGSGLPKVAEVDYARFGEIELVELSRIQQRGADNLSRSWVNLPHVTQHDEADVTDMEAFRRSLKADAESRGVKLTPVAFIIKAVCAGLRQYPNFNSSLHSDGRQLVRKHYINIGMAVDTPQGLVVPVIRGADTKSVWQLSEEIAELSAKARDRKLALDDLQGGTFSVSSLGALGGTGFTPIVNAPEVAILGVGRMQTKPLWDGEAFQPRQMLPLSLSYDHRVINGADGGRFMLFLTEVLGDIRHLAL